MKKLLIVVCSLTLACLLAACEAGTSTSGNADAPQPDSEADDLLRQMDTIYQQLDHSKLPLQEYDYWNDTAPETLAELPKQLVIDTQDAYVYAQLIRNYLYADGNILNDFDDAESMHTPSVIQTAIYHTTPIEWRWSIYGGAENGYEGPFDNHVLSALMKNEAEQGRGLCDLYYEEDVQGTIRKMFGDKAVCSNISAGPYLHYAREKAYGRIGDFGGPVWIYPMLTAMEPTTDGMICEVVLVSALDKESPTTRLHGSDELTSDNFESVTANSAKYRYTFVAENQEIPILSSLHTVRQEI